MISPSTEPMMLRWSSCFRFVLIHVTMSTPSPNEGSTGIFLHRSSSRTTP
uniref:Uncharacterized protein n=1 Tax=Arundo donax TaxID=35708 RepID=A0A0A9H286_ARUDO